MTVPNYSLSCAIDLVSNLNHISVFIQSTASYDSESETELRDLLDKLMFAKIEELSACLSYLIHSEK